MKEQEINQLIVSLLRSEIKCERLQTAVKEKLTADIFPMLFFVSKKHDVANIVGDALSSNEVPVPDDVKAEFKKQRNLAVLRYERIKFELEDICSLLDEKGIDYMPLKGSVIRKFYPRPSMRTSCDIDILIKTEDLKSATDALVNERGFRKEGELVHDVSLYSPANVHVELHFKLSDDDATWDGVLMHAWDECVRYENHSHGYEMSPEYLLAYLTAHNAKHFIGGGCGVRPFADMYLVLKNLTYDKRKLAALLKKCRLEKFWERQIQLVEYWFGDGEATDILLQMQRFVFDGGVYGSTDNRIKASVGVRQSRASYVFRKIFPRFRSMKYSFPVLSKAPFLYPFCVIIRWFKVFLPSKRKRVAYEIKQTQKTTGEKEKMKNFLDQMGF